MGTAYSLRFLHRFFKAFSLFYRHPIRPLQVVALGVFWSLLTVVFILRVVLRGRFGVASISSNGHASGCVDARLFPTCDCFCICMSSSPIGNGKIVIRKARTMGIDDCPREAVRQVIDSLLLNDLIELEPSLYDSPNLFFASNVL